MVKRLIKRDMMVFTTVKDVKATRSTDKAIYVELPNGRKLWIPKSTISEQSEVFDDKTEGVLIVHEWFGKREGL